MEINLISDTITKPTHEMLQYMFNAQVGDDVYKQDPTVIELEARVAEFFGMEAGLFFPSGTMANQTAIKLHTQPGEQLIADKYAHVYHYEGGGVSFNSGVSCCLLDGDRGMINATQVAAAINDPEFYHSPLTSLVCVENTTNKGGGACYELEDLREIKKVCDANNLKFHLDGARIWNALVAKRQNPKEFGAIFDTISVCLSKGLGAPIGSILLGSKADIRRALRIRKILGGGMRQVGYLAAAGLYALAHNIERLAEDHRRAKEIAAVLSTKSWIAAIEPVETNILIFSLAEGYSDQLLIEKLKQKNILISALGHNKLRIVTHLDYKEVMHTYVIETLQKF
ncbi:MULTISPECIES: threonine aldolase family protein [Flavobacterium]|jgi:threonine aldolase|uniref:L-threonine aldolase n=2 Tax=Flavobacterium TaxID=237 RepID=A0A1M7E5I2_9FLAO|nr:MULTISPECIES: GntG family PLP-dependent aldolase [Flavobacterium]OXA76046.1 threonine aldolase [Flavobacterium frigidimaris]SDY37021.1 L-threonine aldolase [Flavobacterium aquidurense]SHL87011.1 L-threonine aldolase [Flavobacterium saccharophilum]